MRTLLLLCAAMAPLLACAIEPQPVMTVPGKLLLSQEFSGPTLPVGWQPGGPPGSFSIVDGVLRGVCAPGDSHGPSFGAPIRGRNVTIQFAMKYVQPGNFLFLLDGESQFGGAAHLLRVGLGPKVAVLQQDRGSTKSKLAQKMEKDLAAKAGRKPPTPTPEQLADPQFYRTERLAMQPRAITDGQWHHALVEVSGSEVVVQVDDGPPMLATSPVMDAEKSRVVFLVGGAATALIDDVKVWENSPRADWSERKAQLQRAADAKK